MIQAFTRTETVAVVVLGIVAGCIPALQPLLLGSLLAEGRIDASLLGRTGTMLAEGRQRGMHSRGYRDAYLGGQETRVRFFHEVLNDYLGGRR